MLAVTTRLGRGALGVVVLGVVAWPCASAIWAGVSIQAASIAATTAVRLGSRWARRRPGT
jgi:hypothetical protein